MKTEITQIKTDEFGFDLKIPYDALFVLYGTSNQGKTSSLLYLFNLLGKKSKHVSNNAVTNLLKSLEMTDPNTGRVYYNDARILLPFENKYIAIATYGDNRDACEDNLFFFRLHNCSVPFYFYDGKRFVESDESTLKKEQKMVLKKSKPTIFISACRTEGGAVDAMEYCSHYYLKHISRIIWIRKLGATHNNTEERVSQIDKKYAKDIYDAINRIIQRKII